MQKIIVAAILAAAICVAGIKTASAADFYWAGSSDMEHITILDPSTISAMQGGHKTFHLAEITTFDMWNDTGIEVDCSGNQMRMISLVTHLGGGDAIDNTSQNKDVNVWHALQLGLNVAGADLVKMHDLVCNYPDQKPSGDDVLTFPDFQAALERVSSVIEEKQKDK